METGQKKEARRCFEKALQISPWRFDIIHNMAFTTSDKKEYEMLIRKAVAMAMKKLPKEFDRKTHQLEWGFTENRPFLRSHHALGLIYLQNKDLKNAAKCFQQILLWNPDDNQGVRELLANTYVLTGNWNEMIILGKEFLEDTTPSIMFGYALALFKTGKTVEAKKAPKSGTVFNDSGQQFQKQVKTKWMKQ